MGDQRTGKIRTVSAQSGHAPVAGGADESGHDRNEAISKKRQKNFPAAAPGFFDLRMSIAESIAGQHEFGRAYRHSGDTGFFQRRRKKTSAESFAIGSEAILERGALKRRRLRFRARVVQQILAEKAEVARDE
jgi:hypothetical protein